MPSKVLSPSMKRFWQRMQEWYGVRFSDAYGGEPPEDWCELIDRADKATLERGLSIIRTKFVTHPPTYPELAQVMAARQLPVRRSMQEQLCAFAARRYGPRLTSRQLRGPWTYIGKPIDDNGIEITGVLIDADGDSPGYRIMVEDMNAPAPELELVQ